MKKIGALILALVLAACANAPGPKMDGQSSGNWSYAKGPHGENCLFWQEGSGQYVAIAMSCDRVTP